MKWVRRNAIAPPVHPWFYTYEMDPVTGKHELVKKPSKPYRSYSKWHLFAPKSQFTLDGKVMSMCGLLNIKGPEAEVSDEQPKGGKRGYGYSHLCANCHAVAKAMS